MLKLFSIVAAAAIMTGCANSPQNVGGGAGNFSYTTSMRPHNFNIVSKDTPGAQIKAGEKATRFELRKGDCAQADCMRTRERVEVTVNGKIELNEDRWFSWYVFIPEDSYFTKQATTTIGQIYMKAQNWVMGKPILQLDITGNVFQTHWHQLTMLRDPVGDDGSYIAEFGYVEFASKVTDLKGKWNQVIVHFNPVIGGGKLEVYLNGKMVREINEPVSIVPENGYTINYGLYRSHLEQERQERGTSIIYYDEIRFGKSREEVDDVLNPALPVVD